ncbi:MAG: hypothetical protein L6R42_007667 [Xanthoria sp. 1 TBL-2021]|nr:MAG: hypothetical protein L6R42_007667 [Xanthoria sp. 1 TBL-2021]
MYVLWFNKPMDIEEPMNVTSKIPDEVIALMLVRNHYFGTPPYCNLTIPNEYRPARLASKKFDLWPGRNVSEAAYLMYNPHIPNNSPSSNNPAERMQDHINASKYQLNRDLPPTPSVGKDIVDTQLQSGHTAESHGHLYQGTPAGRGFYVGQTETAPVTVTSPLPSLIAQHGGREDQSLGSRIQSDAPSVTRAGSDNDSRNPTPADPATQSEYICHGFNCKAADGVQTISTITTGSFVENGIGPMAYVTGGWRDNFRRPDRIAQVPDDLRERLPLARIDPATIVHHFPLTISLSEKDIRRWQLAGSALRDELASSTTRPSDSKTTPFLSFENQADTIRSAYFTTRALLVGWHGPIIEELYSALWGTPSFSGRYIPFLQGLYYRYRELSDLDPGPGTAVTMLPGLLYGGLHLPLWNYKFPSHVEGLLWRLSAIVLILVPAIAAALFIAHAVYQKGLWSKVSNQEKPAMMAGGYPRIYISSDDRRTEYPQRWSEKLAASVKRSLLLGMWLLVSISLVMIGCLYIFSRVFIIVESFISLRHVPVGVYEEVGWSKYIPHL